MTASERVPRRDGYASAAAIYNRHGWRGVLPLQPDTKWPPPTGYTGRQGVFPTDTETLEWANRRPGDGIALRLPRGVIGIDVDVYGSKRGDLTLTELETTHGPLPDTWTSTSRGAGPSRIHLFRCPTDLELPGTAGDSIEIIQFHHRYMVAWPTVVEGRCYQWYDQFGDPVDRPPRLKDLTRLPEAWEHLRPRRIALEDRPVRPVALTGDWSKAVSRYHAEGVAALGQAGGRHDGMLPVVMTLVRLDHDGHPGASQALDDLHARFVSAVTDRSTLKAAELEWQRMLDGAEQIVAVTPSTRGAYDDLRRDDVDDLIVPPAPPRDPPPRDDTDPDPDPDVDDEQVHGWEPVDLAPVVDGNYQRPAPTLLRRRT